MTTILMTGAGGRIGTHLRRLMPRPGETWRLADLKPLEPGPGEEVMTGDLGDADFARAACDGVDAIVHLAGNPGESPWPQEIGPNVLAAINLWEAAREADVGRVVYASSNHLMGMYRRTDRLSHNDPMRPELALWRDQGVLREPRQPVRHETRRPRLLHPHRVVP